ncbi:MAG: hypothetical protein KAJ18_06395 [Candidatus Omnitrophica bacterium]|nr:hypothetical protein [Candidatus Omnitrophota bacterium]
MNKFNPDPSFDFIEEDHTYWLRGNKISSVSRVLESIFPFKGNRDFISSIPMFRGQFIHKCVNMEMNGTLDVDKLDEAEREIMLQFKGFICSSGLKFQRFIGEVPMYHRLFEYGFTADALFSNGLLIDAKTGSYKVPERDQMQLMAYVEGLKSWGHKVTDIMILRLTEKGYIPEKHEIDRNVFRHFISEFKKIA